MATPLFAMSFARLVLIAVRYQIMVMCMLTGASGIAAAIYLALTARKIN